MALAASLFFNHFNQTYILYMHMLARPYDFFNLQLTLLLYVKNQQTKHFNLKKAW